MLLHGISYLIDMQSSLSTFAVYNLHVLGHSYLWLKECAESFFCTMTQQLSTPFDEDPFVDVEALGR